MLKEKETLKNKLSDVLLAVKWSHVSTNYFNKGRSWFSQRLNGYDGNGKTIDFSDKDKETLKNALFDLSNRIRKAAEKI